MYISCVVKFLLNRPSLSISSCRSRYEADLSLSVVSFISSSMGYKIVREGDMSLHSKQYPDSEPTSLCPFLLILLLRVEATNDNFYRVVRIFQQEDKMMKYIANSTYLEMENCKVPHQLGNFRDFIRCLNT